MEPLLSVADVATRLALSKQRIWQLVKKWELPVTWVKKRAYFTPQQFGQFVDKRSEIARRIYGWR